MSKIATIASLIGGLGFILGATPILLVLGAL